ncbi:hypothetical protein NXH76_03890 [Blautia schinkii]|nr:hypothetical protein [Blautia schinkii]
MDDKLARSNKQKYFEHVGGVIFHALAFLEEREPFIPADVYGRMKQRLVIAALFHDLGKLDVLIQDIFNSGDKYKALPFPHQYPGAYYMFLKCKDVYTAALIYGHHKPGLPDFNSQVASDVPFCSWKNHDFSDKLKLQERIEHMMQGYLEDHANELRGRLENFSLREMMENCSQNPPTTLEERFLLSILVNADWNDARESEQKDRENCGVKKPDTVKPETIRLETVKSETVKPMKIESDKMNLEKECAHLQNLRVDRFLYWDGWRKKRDKRTALEYLVSEVRKRKLLKICIVITYPHECREWEAAVKKYHIPIEIMTEIEFFGKLSSNTPSQLNGLYKLIGSAVFFDGFIEKLHPRNVPLVWKWLGELSELWGCFIVCASDKMVRFWELVEYQDKFEKYTVPPSPQPVLLSEYVTGEGDGSKPKVCLPVNTDEADRYSLSKVEELVNFVLSKHGPRIIVVDKSSTAERIAFHLKDRSQEVYCVSEKLKGENGSKLWKSIEDRIAAGEKTAGNEQWTLVTTYSSEFNRGLFFKNGFGMLTSFLDFLRLADCVNSEGAGCVDVGVWIFELDDVETETETDSNMEYDKEAFRYLLEERSGEFEKLTASDLATLAHDIECKMKVDRGNDADLLKLEMNWQLKEVAERFFPDVDSKSLSANR